MKIRSEKLCFALSNLGSARSATLFSSTERNEGERRPTEARSVLKKTTSCTPADLQGKGFERGPSNHQTLFQGRVHAFARYPSLQFTTEGATVVRMIPCGLKLASNSKFWHFVDPPDWN